MNPLERLNVYKDSFTASEIQIMNYILDNPFDIMHLSIVEIGKKSGTSKTAIIRLCQKIGYKGFSEFKFDLSRYLISNNQNADNNKNVINAITSSYADCINRINNTLSLDDIQNLSKLMISSNRVKLLGCNRTGFSISQFRYRLSKIGFDAEAITDSLLMKDCINILNDKDLCIIFSIKGAKHPYLDCVKILKDNNCRIVLVTMNPLTPLKPYCDQLITLPYVSKQSDVTFLDDQLIFFVLIEIILCEIANSVEYTS